MQTKCPNCSKLQIVPDQYAGRTLKCGGCKQAFEAVFFIDPLEVITPAKPPVEYWPQRQAEHVDTPGFAFKFFGCIFGIIGILGGIAAESGPIAFFGLSFLLFFCAIGAVLSRLERIAHHLERLRSEQKENQRKSA